MSVIVFSHSYTWTQVPAPSSGPHKVFALNSYRPGLTRTLTVWKCTFNRLSFMLCNTLLRTPKHRNFCVKCSSRVPGFYTFWCCSCNIFKVLQGFLQIALSFILQNMGQQRKTSRRAVLIEILNVMIMGSWGWGHQHKTSHRIIGGFCQRQFTELVLHSF